VTEEAREKGLYFIAGRAFISFKVRTAFIYSTQNRLPVDDVTAHLGIRPNDLCENKMAIGQALRDAARAVLMEDSKKRRCKGQSVEHRTDSCR